MMGIWKNNPQIETEIRKESPIDTSIFKKKTSSKSFQGFLIGKIKQARNEGNKELVFLISEILKKYNEFHKKESKSLIEIEIIEGWKGIDNIEIIKGFTNDFIIKSHTKDKETGEITSNTHQIPYHRVNTILSVIKRMKVGEKVKCYDFSPYLGFKTWKDLWKERKDYFDLYYYPIKVLEALGIIKYGGRGDITRIK